LVVESDEGEMEVLELDAKLEEEAEGEVTDFDVEVEPFDDEEVLLLDFELAVEDGLADVVEVFDANSLPAVEDEL